MIKMIAIAVILSMIGGAAWYVVNLAADNERLRSNALSLEKSNNAYVAAMVQLNFDMAKKEEAIIRRTKKILSLNRAILKAKNEIKNIVSQVTQKERECLAAPIPDAVVNFMFSKGAGSGGSDSGEGLSIDSVLQ